MTALPTLDPDAPIPYALTAGANRTLDGDPPEGAAFGSWLRAARERRGWSQAHLAALVGCAQETLSGVERGIRPGHAVRQPILQALGHGHCPTCICEAIP